MSIELKQAAQQAVDAFDAFGDDDDFASLFALAQKMKALHTAIRQAEVTDQLIESEFQRCGGKWNGDQWVIEDADLHPFCRAILALRPVLVPMTDEQVDAFTVNGRLHWLGKRQLIRGVEAYYGITAQAKKEAP